MTTFWKGDYWYLIPSIAFYNDKEELYLKFSFLKYNFGISIEKKIWRKK
jgi:hypothetical protein